MPISLNVFARREFVNDPDLVSLTADFNLPAGVSFNSTPGTFGQSGTIGSGAIAPAPVSGFERNSSNTRVASLSLDFLSAQTIPLCDTRLATLSIDPTGLVIGPYFVIFLATEANADTVLNSGVAGSFTITAVPELSTMLLIASASVISVIRHRRHRVALAQRIVNPPLSRALNGRKISACDPFPTPEDDW